MPCDQDSRKGLALLLNKTSPQGVFDFRKMKIELAEAEAERERAEAEQQRLAQEAAAKKEAERVAAEKAKAEAVMKNEEKKKTALLSQMRAALAETEQARFAKEYSMQQELFDAEVEPIQDAIDAAVTDLKLSTTSEPREQQAKSLVYILKDCMRLMFKVPLLQGNFKGLVDHVDESYFTQQFQEAVKKENWKLGESSRAFNLISACCERIDSIAHNFQQLSNLSDEDFMIKLSIFTTPDRDNRIYFEASSKEQPTDYLFKIANLCATAYMADARKHVEEVEKRRERIQAAKEAAREAHRKETVEQAFECLNILFPGRNFNPEANSDLVELVLREKNALKNDLEAMVNHLKERHKEQADVLNALDRMLTVFQGDDYDKDIVFLLYFYKLNDEGSMIDIIDNNKPSTEEDTWF